MNDIIYKPESYSPHSIREELNKSWHDMDRELVHDALKIHADMIERCVGIATKINLDSTGSRSPIPKTYSKEQVIDFIKYIVHGDGNNA